jgi:hypothetical protein
VESADPPPALPTPAPLVPPRSSTGWSRQLHAVHTELAAAEVATAQAARARRRPGRPPVQRCISSFADGVEVLKDCTELHLASFCVADVELCLAGADDPAYSTLKVKYGLRRQCRRTAAWSLNLRRATPRCSGHGLCSSCRTGSLRCSLSSLTCLTAAGFSTRHAAAVVFQHS